MDIINYLYPFLITFIITLILIKYPVAISIPNNRGLHDAPIATSGGLAVFLGIAAIFISIININLIILITMAGIMTLTGLLDDKYSLSVALRFVIQLMLFSVFLIYYPTDMTQNIFVFIMIVFICSYIINIFNFMDGIDLLATLQTIYTFSALQIILYDDISVIPNLMNLMNYTIATLVCFSIFNKSPAKIFLGNSGSYLLGFLIVIILYFITTANSSNIIPVLIIFTAFLCDSTYTLVARFIDKFRSDNSSFYRKVINSLKILSNPHKTHLYQKLVEKHHHHGKVNLFIMSYNLLWCLPLAFLVLKLENYSIYLLTLSYIPYILWCYSVRAGVAIDND